MEGKIKIHLADDHQVLIDGILALLKSNTFFEVVGISLNGLDIIQKISRNKADILILDINMPEKDGISVLREMNALSTNCKVIVLSSYDDPTFIKEVVKLGASGYLTKQCAGENIIDAITAVAYGNQYFSDLVKDKIFNTYTQNYSGNTNFLVSEEIIKSITNRELEILKLISQEKSGKEIGVILNISFNTVETHRKNLMKKLKVKSSIGLVLFATKNSLL